MSKTKDVAATSRAVVEYLTRQNRPYSVTDILNNMGKEYGKTAVTKACEYLAASKEIHEKVYGKQKVYVSDQSKFPDVDDAELKGMERKITELTDAVQQSQDAVRRLESGQYEEVRKRSRRKSVQMELKTLNTSISTEDAKTETRSIEEELISLRTKLEKLSEGQVLLSPEEKEKVYKARLKYVKEWRKRKRISNDIINAVLEGYPKTKKQLLEEIGLETDEEYNVKPPDV